MMAVRSTKSKQIDKDSDRGVFLSNIRKHRKPQAAKSVHLNTPMPRYSATLTFPAINPCL